MTLRDFLRQLVLGRFDTIRAGAVAMGMPTTTLHSLTTDKEASYRIPRPADLADLLDRLNEHKPVSSEERDEARRLLEEADREKRDADRAVTP